jgi:hypothetical protein
VRNLEMEIDIYNTAWFFFILQGWKLGQLYNSLQPGTPLDELLVKEIFTNLITLNSYCIIISLPLT